jgi:pimeloyl-ACP methyl ester carboxylesterase
MAARGKASAGEVMLAGYSRGGCTAIIAARRLKDRGVGVHSLFLFDAVDMQTSEMHLSQIISDNVRMVAHVRTARNLPFWIRNPVKSRFYFYNTGRYLAGSGSYDTKSFVCSHGAVGGVPWLDIKEDAGCVLAVDRMDEQAIRKPETDRDAQTVRPPPARPGRGSALPSPMAEQMKTLLILTTMIGLSGCVNDQSKLSKGTHVPSSGFGGGFGYTSPGACAAARN